MDTTPMRHSHSAVLMLDQRLRRWTNMKPTLGECTMFAGKALQSIHAWGRAPHRNKTVSFQTPSLEHWWKYYLIDVAQVYGLTMIWEHLLLMRRWV